MTVDVEDYFQVSAFDGAVSRASWDSRESRVCRNTERLLDLFAASNVKATFFVLGWVAERFPGLVRRIVSDGHELASHGYEHRLVYSQTSREFREDLRRARVALEQAGGMSGPRVSRAELLDRSPVAVGARRADRGGVRLRLQHLPDSARPLRDS